MNLEDHELAELLTLTRTVSKMGVIRYKNHLDQLHRVHGPAVIWPSGTLEWYQHGTRHRTGGAALIYGNGSEYWYHQGTRHRIGGPAITLPDGSQYWIQNGDNHREDGPAVINSDGTVRWIWLDHEVSEAQHAKLLAQHRAKTRF